MHNNYHETPCIDPEGIVLPETLPKVRPIGYEFKRKTSFAAQWQQGYIVAKLREIRL